MIMSMRDSAPSKDDGSPMFARRGSPDVRAIILNKKQANSDDEKNGNAVYVTARGARPQATKASFLNPVSVLP
jgi:hypothetical protein